MIKNRNVIGVIDAYGAIHYRRQRDGETLSDLLHGEIWPTIHHKRWRFDLQEWDYVNKLVGNLNKASHEVCVKVFPFNFVDWGDGVWYDD